MLFLNGSFINAVMYALIYIIKFRFGTRDWIAYCIMNACNCSEIMNLLYPEMYPNGLMVSDGCIVIKCSSTNPLINQ